jgi:hypothetical protein
MFVQHTTKPYTPPYRQPSQVKKPLQFFSLDSFQKSVHFGNETPHIPEIPPSVLNLTYDSYFLSRMLPELLQDQELVRKLVKFIDGKSIDDTHEMTIPIGKVLRDNPNILERLSPLLAGAFAKEVLDFMVSSIKEKYDDDWDPRGEIISRHNLYNAIMSKQPASVFYWQRDEKGVLEYTAALYQFPEEPSKAMVMSDYTAPHLMKEHTMQKLYVKLITRAKQFGLKTLVIDARPLDVPILESLGFRIVGKQHVEGSIWMESLLENTP